MVRRSGLLVVVIAGVLVAGCKDKGDESAPASPEQQAKLDTAEQEITDRRGALLSARKALAQKREALDQRAADLKAAGEDTAAVETERKAVADQLGRIDEFTSLLDNMEGVLRQQKSALAGGGAAVTIASRESGVASREKSLSQREAALAKREAELSKRESSMASKWKESCAVGTPTTIVQTVDAKGSTYNKRDVDGYLSRSDREMRKKGIRLSDVNGGRGLRADAISNMKKGDYGQAYYSARSLHRAVKATNINRAFVGAKIGRLSSRVKGKSTSSDVDRLFKRATQQYGDGNYKAANKTLNRIFGMI